MTGSGVIRHSKPRVARAKSGFAFAILHLPALAEFIDRFDSPPQSAGNNPVRTSR